MAATRFICTLRCNEAYSGIGCVARIGCGIGSVSVTIAEGGRKMSSEVSWPHDGLTVCVTVSAAYMPIDTAWW